MGGQGKYYIIHAVCLSGTCVSVSVLQVAGGQALQYILLCQELKENLNRTVEKL
jgi:hypothetical protein